ncbi:6-bladed beta-propeller [Cyclobacterium plantarum]|uniref:6-bladed beta-propeller n=1 Tax=Cyclobacterium plantarum TaxID=2716263 RepID=A0ABX0H5H8_9BACT|nr:6-bladed beta-propeller [Cyclobacterium plantarum]NHE56787.1 6-bladed beta-propeller [Cyclobacterium plantarum]
MEARFLLQCILWISLLVACNKTIEQKDGLPQIELEKIKEISTPYSIETITPLETDTANLIGDHLTVKFSENSFFIYDESARDAVHQFDLDGKYLGKFVEIGEGPGMLRGINDFIPTPEGMDILSVKGDQAEIIRLDKEGQQLETISIDYMGTSFAPLPGDQYVASGSYNLPFVKNRLAVINEKGETINEWLPNTHEILPFGEKNFYTLGEHVFFHEIYNPNTYMVQADSLLPRYQFDFGKYSIPERFFEMDWMAGFEMLNQQGFATISQYWENEDKAFFEVAVQVNGELNKHQVILEKASGEVSKRIISATELTAFYSPVGLMDDLLVFIAQTPDYLILETDQLPENSPKIQEGDNPVLLFVEF